MCWLCLGLSTLPRTGLPCVWVFDASSDKGRLSAEAGCSFLPVPSNATRPAWWRPSSSWAKADQRAALGSEVMDSLTPSFLARLRVALMGVAILPTCAAVK